MRSLALVLTSFNLLQVVIRCQELSVIRHSDGDIFTIEGSCTEACTVLSSGTASPYSRGSSSASLLVPNSSCTCQCNFDLPIFREDLHICVNDIHECNVAGFVNSNGHVERVPYVFLPQRGQIIYPHAEIRFEGVTTPVCGIAGAQQLGRAGWSELRNLSDAEPPFRLFRDEGRTFLQWIGEAGLRDAAEGRVVTAKLVCRDASPKSTFSGVFTPCVAFRVAGSPSKNSVREVMFSSTSQVSQGLSATEYTAIGLSSIILALIYVASVSLYLHSRRTKRKSIEEANITLDGSRDGGGLVKSNPLLAATRHFESDTNSGLTESDLGEDLPASDNEQGFENVTSAIVHPHCVYLEQSEGPFPAGAILGERLPEEDVRVVETADNPHQQDVPVLPGAQRRKLYFNPAYFDRQLLLAPPPAAIEFLLKIREVISIAKHKMAAKRFVPTLTGIPEEEGNSERCESAKSSKHQQRTTASSVQGGSVAKSRRSQRCTGCPGCSESPRQLPALPVPDLPSHGESKVRAWLEDVRPPQRRWRDAEDTRRNFQENARTFARNLEYLKELARRDFADPDDCANLVGKSVSSWKDNPPMLRTFQNIAARSEILENDDRHSVSRRSTRSMYEGSEYNRYGRGKRANGRPFQFNGGDDAINAKVRKAIENSFIKQLEENAAMESETKENVKDDRNSKSEDESAKTERSSSNTDKSEKSRSQQSQNSHPVTKRSKKSKAPCAPPLKKKELPDMINELPGAKNTAKRIMDAVIREMVDVKALDHHHVKSSERTVANGDYEVDSLERSKCSRKSSTSPDQSSTDNQSSPALSTALPMDEELTMQNAVINTRTGEMTMSKLSNQILAERNCYNSLPELISSQRSETYSLVSEVYVNDGYASPACSDDSGPEIQYEPENPGHLTIKVQDSPENYVKLDESEYEPDTLDRKPMKLRINDDVQYDRREIANEIYVDSLERPAQILLRSRGSFRDENSTLQRNGGSLREIYEAKIKSSLKNSHLTNGHDSECQMNGESDGSHSWKKCRYLTPDSRQAKRQRQPHNQPDVVPLPPAGEEIYQRPKPPRRVEDAKLPPLSPSKNAWDGSSVGAGNPTASNGAPVPKTDGYHVGDQTCLCASQTQVDIAKYEEHCDDIIPLTETTFFNERIGECMVTNGCRDCPCETRIEIEVPENRYRFYGHVGSSKEEVSVRGTKMTRDKRSITGSSHHRSSTRSSRTRSWSVDYHREDEDKLLNNSRAQNCSRTKQLMKGLSKSCDSSSNVLPLVGNRRGHIKIEDSGYLSSTDSNGSHKRLLRHEVSSVSETDETESVCDGASESGAESVGTDSVFFGNFRKLSEISKSADSGVDVEMKNPSYYQPLFGAKIETAVTLERTNFSTSDSETESLVTVLPPCNGQCKKLVS
ncbi:uncharacterized protein LOC105830770 isoform X2 [Monomorium pharaonis]|nr:uncharacterized protein LOC105830770 isoform X2 [Monomorium pharaonis]XP_036144666.1 uncharacterized protein LOC105830770 isoform X2 [Monomorium pharaonis]XP_036144667.1 uncharacterized protein LOC105830770 isoform X2 [Monomorium pharaonis]